MPEGKVALVLGASGVTGWAAINEILNDYPKKGVWSRVHALANRPLTAEEAMWPRDDRVVITSGLDLLAGTQEDVQKKLLEVPGLADVTHVFYFGMLAIFTCTACHPNGHLAYKGNTDYSTEVAENVEMFKRAATAVDALCPKLELLVNQTGSKMYGCHLLHDRPAEVKPPFKEDGPKLEGTSAATLFYPGQLDFLTELSNGKKWKWFETRPDIIVGFVPHHNFYGLGTSLGFFLSLFREINGEGAECPFPGTVKSWVALNQDAGANMIARQTIHIGLSPGLRSGTAYNLGDERGASNWSAKWPIICAEFGLKGVKAPEDNPVEVRKYIKDNHETWRAVEEKHGLKKGHADNERAFPGHEHFLLSLFELDRHYDLGRLYDEAGFPEERKAGESYKVTFERMKKAKLIP